MMLIARLAEYDDLPAIHLFVVGKGHDRDRLEKRIKEMDLDESITLVGAVEPESMKIWYTMADLFVFASKSETQGMVILEAMAGGSPVVAMRAT